MSTADKIVVVMEVSDYNNWKQRLLTHKLDEFEPRPNFAYQLTVIAMCIVSIVMIFVGGIGFAPGGGIDRGPSIALITGGAAMLMLVCIAYCNGGDKDCNTTTSSG